MQRQPLSRHLDAMSSVRGEPNRDGVADEHPAGEHPGDEDDARREAVLLVDVDDARQAGGHPGDGKGGLHPAAIRVEPAR